MKTCPCGSEITKDQHCVETPDHFAKRYNSGYCRSKCKRIYSPPKQERTTGTLEAISANYERPDMVQTPKDMPARDEARKAFARSMPCCVCGEIQGIHAHHEQEEGQGTMGGKTSDRRTIPLCPLCHMMRHDKGRGWYDGMNIGRKIEQVIRQINEAYDNR